MENERLCVCEKKLKKPKCEKGGPFFTVLLDHRLILFVYLNSNAQIVKKQRKILEKLRIVVSLKNILKQKASSILLTKLFVIHLIQIESIRYFLPERGTLEGLFPEGRLGLLWLPRLTFPLFRFDGRLGDTFPLF